MHNIIKSLNYQTSRDNFLIYSFLPAIYMYMVFLIDYFKPDSFDALNGGTLTVILGQAYMMVIPFTVLILGTRICGWDYSDKTMYYEILAGHRRKDVYWGRVIVCITWCMAVNIIIIALPVIIITLLNSWGDNMDLGGALLRYTLLLFPVFRTICEYILITFLLKSCYKAMIACFIFIEMSACFVAFMSELKIFDSTWHLSISNIIVLFEFNGKLGYVNGEDIEIYETALDPSFIAGTVIASLVAGAACLIAGYLVFKKRDAN